MYLREVTQVDTFRCTCIDALYEVLINILGHERNHRSCCFCNSYKCGVQSHISIDLILLHAFCPETLTGAAYIPVTHIIHEGLQCFCCLRDTVICQVVVYSFYSGFQTGQQPFIHNSQLVILQTVFCCIEVVDVCIQNKERVGVPQGSHELSLSFHDRLACETARQPWSAAGVEVPADRIGTVGLQCVKRIYRISFGFTHLLSVLILYQTKNDNVFVWCFVEQ